MADGREPAPGISFRRLFPWTDIFRCFQVALDPRKLAIAALGILAMSLGWYVLSTLFYYEQPNPDAEKYKPAVVGQDNKTKPGSNEAYSEAELAAIGQELYRADKRRWLVMNDLAGPDGEGRLRTMPWDEYRGPNPYDFVMTLLGGSARDRSNMIGAFIGGSVPVLVEPLIKFLVPVSKLFSPDAGFWTRVYLVLAILWFLAVWGFCGGVITRLAAVSLTNKGPITLKQAVRFVCTRYVNYFMSPLVPLIIIAAVVVGLVVYGFLSLIPILGDIVLLGFGLPLIVAAGGVMAIFLIGLVGYPLMYTTLSTEGDSSDTFDALSRSINYVYQAPWNYIWYGLVTIVYGAIVTFFVLFFVSLSVYLGKWAVSQTPLTETFNRNPDYLFLWAPESFGWREMLLKGSPAEVRPEVKDTSTANRTVIRYEPVDKEKRDQYRKGYYFYNVAGAGIVAVWLTIIFLLMLGFIYSFYWSAATMIYLLMRKKVDEADLDEIYIEEEEPEAPLPPVKADAPAPTSLNVLPPPSPPAPAATIPFTPPEPPLPMAPPEPPKATDGNSTPPA